MLAIWILLGILITTAQSYNLRQKRQQTDDQWYYMNRGMLMVGQGLTEMLTNQKYDGDYFSGVMEPHDPDNHQQQQMWYKNYYGSHGRRF